MAEFKLASYARKFLGVPAMSVPIERVSIAMGITSKIISFTKFRTIESLQFAICIYDMASY